MFLRSFDLPLTNTTLVWNHFKIKSKSECLLIIFCGFFQVLFEFGIFYFEILITKESSEQFKVT